MLSNFLELGLINLLWRIDPDLKTLAESLNPFIKWTLRWQKISLDKTKKDSSATKSKPKRLYTTAWTIHRPLWSVKETILHTSMRTIWLNSHPMKTQWTTASTIHMVLQANPQLLTKRCPRSIDTIPSSRHFIKRKMTKITLWYLKVDLSLAILGEQ